MQADGESFRPQARAAEKQRARMADERAILSARKSVAQVKRENEVLAPLASGARIDLSASRSLGQLMPEKPPLRPEEVRRILRELAPLSEERRIILVGGQAVAFQAAFFELKPRSSEREIFASKDIDFEGAARSARRAGELLGGDVRIPTIDDHTPNTGIVLFKDSDGENREIDFLVAPYGLDGRDVRDTAVRLS